MTCYSENLKAPTNLLSCVTTGHSKEQPSI
jgi:hypothetical protein